MSENLRARLDEAIAEHRLLDHPFYQAWAEGVLTRADLRFYAGQYWRQVEAFPAYLEDLGERIDDPVAGGIVSANLADEREGDHPGLWLRFAEALGADRASVEASRPEPETQDCVRTFATAMDAAPIPYALGMLYGYECQTPEVAQTKVAGLRDHYGIEGEGVTYFTLHGELDVEHADELVAALERVVSSSAAEDAVAGARAGAKAIWGLLDGVERVRMESVTS